MDTATPSILEHMAALADPTRVRMLRPLEQHELTVTDLCAVLQLPQSTVSRHLKTLADDGWVLSRRDGTSRLYTLATDTLDDGARQLWPVIREQVGSALNLDEDDRRLASVLQRRREKSRAFFSTAAGEWDRLRVDLFGERVYMSALLALLSRTSPLWFMERVEWITLVFFCGLFVVVGALEHTEVFARVAQWLQGLFGNDIGTGILLVGFFSALISGVVDNIPFTISMAYVLRDLEAALGTQMDPLWWALSLGACLGGNLTLIGASANVVTADLAARAGHPIRFTTFLLFGTPVAAVTVTLALLGFWLLHRPG